MKKVDPFTRTPGLAGDAFIDTHYADEIIYNFESEKSSKYVYKIVGLRGSGKSVEYRKIVNAMSDKKGWLVYTLSAGGDPVTTLIAKLSKESFIDSKKHVTSVQTGAAAEAGAVIFKGKADVTVSKTSEENVMFFSQEATLGEMLREAKEHGFKVLVGIDDIAKTEEMTKFLSMLGTFLLDEKMEIYFICTGLAKNIEDFANEPNLTFFKRSDLVEIKELDKFEIAAMYQRLLDLDSKEAVSLAKFTEGYAYAYQVLGSLYFNKKSDEGIEDLIPEFDKILFRDSYDLIWKSLTVAERELVRIIVTSDTGKAADIKAEMKSPSGYDSLRARLDNKHILDTSQRGYVRIPLPRFKEYVTLWHGDD